MSQVVEHTIKFNLLISIQLTQPDPVTAAMAQHYCSIDSILWNIQTCTHFIGPVPDRMLNWAIEIDPTRPQPGPGWCNVYAMGYAVGILIWSNLHYQPTYNVTFGYALFKPHFRNFESNFGCVDLRIAVSKRGRIGKSCFNVDSNIAEYFTISNGQTTVAIVSIPQN